MPKKQTALTRQPKQPNLVNTSWDLLSENSQAGYKTDLNMFYDFVKKELPEVTAQDIVDYVFFLRSKKYKNSTINRKIASVSKLFKVYHISGLIKFNPIELARQSGKLTFKTIRAPKNILKIADVKKCIKFKDTSRSDRDAGIMIKFLAKTGLRISEMLNIELKDISDLDGKTASVRILGKGKKERFITIEKSFIKEIQGVFNHKELLFCTAKNEKYNRRYVWRLVKDRFRRSVGIDAHPHMLRHFYATHKIIVEGKDLKAVSLFLGHSSTAITADIYLNSQLDADGARMDL